MGGSNGHTLNDYQQAFVDFEKDLKQLYENPTNREKKYDGFFVNFNGYNSIKNNVFQLQNGQPILDQNGKVMDQNNIKFGPLKAESLNEVNENIKLNHIYIIINETLFEYLCDPTQTPNNKIKYKITGEKKLAILLENGTQMLFNYKGYNIITKQSALGYIQNDNYNNTNNSNQALLTQNEDKIYENMKIYIDNEKEISNKLNTPNSGSIYQGFLVDKIWVDNWKKNCCYDYINQYFLNNIADEKTIKSIIKKSYSDCKLNYNDIKYIDNYILLDIAKLKDPINANKSYVILNGNFISKYLNNQLSVNPINFYFSYQTIRIKFMNQTDLFYHTNNNIINNISSNIINNNINNNNISPTQQNLNLVTKNRIYISQFLIHLIRFPYFKKKLKSGNYSFQNGPVSVFIVNKEIINILKQKFDIKNKIFENSELIKFLDNLTYETSDKNYSAICNHLNEKNFDYINKIKKLEEPGMITFEEKESSLTFKFINNNQPNLKYIGDIELIDQSFYSFLNQKFNNSLTMFSGYYAIKEDKILLIIIANPAIIFEIVSFSPKGSNIIVEYIIEIENKSNIEINYLIKFISSIFHQYGLKNLISGGNKINIGNNIILNFHPIISDFRKNEIINNIEKKENRENNRNNTNNYITQIINQDKIKNQEENWYNKRNKLAQSQFQSYIYNQPNDENLGTSQNLFYLINNEFYQLLLPNLNLDNNDYHQNMNFISNSPENIFDYDSFKIGITEKQVDNLIFRCPINFKVINEVTYKKIIQILNYFKIKSTSNLFEEINYISFNERFVFAPKNYNFLHNNNLIYLYSNEAKMEINLYKLIAIFECFDIHDRDNKFNIFIQNQNNKNIIQNPKFFEKQFQIKCHLIKDRINNIDEEKPNIASLPVFEAKTNLFNPQTTINNNSHNFGLNQNISDINEKLKTMILLCISQIFNIDNQYEKVYLMSREWLEQFGYKKIKEFLEKKSNQIIQVWNRTYQLNSLTKIISLFDYRKLKKFEAQLNIQNQNSWIAIPEKVKLLDKYIYLYRKFVLVNDNIFALFQKYFGIKQTKDDIFYFHKCMENDLIIFKNQQLYNEQKQIIVQNLILFGNINKKENKYEIKYIFDYKETNILETEFQIIKNYHFPNYIFYRTVISQQNNKDIFSPIFGNNNEIIGNYYLYIKNKDYTDCDPYYKCLNNELIKNLFDIYRNESYIKNRIKSNYNYNNIIDEEFYLIKKEALNDIQIENNYEQLKSFFKGRITNISPSQKEIYIAIRSLEKYQFKDLVNNLNKVNIQTDPKKYEIEIEDIHNPNNQSEIYYIFKDFELVNKNIADSLLNGKYPLHKLKCSFVGNGNIVFHYSINEIKNINYICVISKIDENNNFINEYLLIYKNQSYYLQHFENIKYQLNNFLQRLRFMKGTSPIVINGYIEIGSVFQLTGQNNDLEYFPPIPFDIIDINQDFQSKPLIGFENIGATCYMNATIQCLCNIKKFVEYFKYNKHIKTIVEDDINKEKLCSAFKRLIEYSYPYEFSQNFYNYKMKNPNKKIPIYHDTSKKSYPPENFKETISRLNPLFEGVAANDAKDLVNFLIMTLHEETNTAPPNQVDNNQGNMSMDQTNKMAMFTKFLQNFAQNYRSVISDLFYALNCNITQCGNCQKISYNYQIYFFLNFPLEEVRKYKLQNNNQIMNNNFNNFNNNIVNNIVDIYDCFLYDQKINFMCGENAMYCNYCRQTCGSSMCTLLTSGPKILIIILNRGKGIEFNVKINFYPEINLNNYIEKKDFNWQYELFGVITHIGESGMGGHFIAYCKEFWTNHWLKYNDALVSPVNDFKSEVIDFAMPYLLFYQIKE